MTVFLLKRVLSSILLLFTVVTINFLFLFSKGQDIARSVLGDAATPEQVSRKTAALGLDQPLLAQYRAWLWAALHGNLGSSWYTGQSVVAAIGERAVVTFTLAITAIVLAAIVAAALGMAAAVRRGWVDRLVQVMAVIGYAIPGFIIAMGLVLLFAIKLRVLPATGYVRVGDSLGGWARSIALPVTALVIATVASTAQQIRSAVIDVMRRDYVRTLRSRGIGETEILWKHVLRSAAPPGLTVLSLQFIGLLGGTVIVEQVFSLPGLGSLAIQATTRSDLPILLGVIITTVLLVVVVNLVIDLAVAWLNPKARVS